METIEIHPKGWGHEKWIVNEEKYCGKLLFFEAGKKCSWHYHKIKDETVYVQSGEIVVIYGSDDNMEKAKVIIMKPGDKLHVPPGMKHQMKARVDTELFEFSTQHFEDDSYRIERGD